MKNDPKFPVGKVISFNYKDKFVKGKILLSKRGFIVISLLQDYKGKNEDWYNGEAKLFKTEYIEFPIKEIEGGE